MDRPFLSTPADGSFVDLWTHDDGSGRQRWIFAPHSGMKNAVAESQVESAARSTLSAPASADSYSHAASAFTAASSREHAQSVLSGLPDARGPDYVPKAKLAALQELGLSVEEAVACGINIFKAPDAVEQTAVGSQQSGHKKSRIGYLGTEVVVSENGSFENGRDAGPRVKRRACEVAGDFDVQLEASEDDIAIGRVLTAQGDEFPLDEALCRIQETVRGAAVSSFQSVKQELGEEMVVQCREIRYSQASCSSKFRHGPYQGCLLEVVVDDLIRGTVKPLEDDWFVLDVVKRDGKLISVDNRRLFCLHEFQRRYPSKVVWARIRVKFWDSLFDRFLNHSDSANNGTSIYVRHAGRVC